MLRSLLRASAAIAFAFLLAPAVPEAASAPGLSYDEIVRVVATGTPPPPGNFPADIAAIGTETAAATPSPAPHKHGLNLGALSSILPGALAGGAVGNVAGSVVTTVASQAISQALANSLQQSVGAQMSGLAAKAMAFMQPHLTRYAYWNGWERVDDVAARTATIRKCDAGQVIKLDLAHQTYSIYDPASEPAEEPAAAPPPHRGAPPTAEPLQPGTAAVDLSSATKVLGPLRFQDTPATGYQSTVSLSISRATGSCHDANSSIEETQYLSALARPTVNNCPIRRRPIPQSADEMVTTPSAPTGGCRPTFTAHRSGPTPPSNRLALYSLLSFSGGATAQPAPGSAGKFGFLTERGNLKTLGAADSGLFSIPQGFTKSP